MAELTIDSVDYAAGVGTGTTDYEDLRVFRRRFSGAMSSEAHGDNLHAKSVRVATGILTRSEGEDLVATLKAAGYLSCAGDLLGSATDYEAQNVTQQDGPLQDMVVVSCDLKEVL